MNREMALKIVLAIVGLLFLALAYPLILFARQDPAMSMMFSLYVTLGVFLLLAVRDPAANRSLIGFTAWSSLAHAVVMGIQAMENMVARVELIGVAVLVVIGLALIALAPAKQRGSAHMSPAIRAVVAVIFSQIVLPSAIWQAQAQNAKTPYPKMAPLDQYLMERNAEITLARSAAPESISRDAEVMVMGRHSYETVAKGKNGFVCVVQRSWTAGPDDPDFWNPKLRAPICFNPPAVRSYLPQTIKKTEWILAGKSKAQMVEGIRAALDKKELPAPEVGAMCYMMSKQGYLNDRDGHWHPHLMFFLPPTDAKTWGADQPGSPILAAPDTLGRLTIFMVPVGKWSDGTPAH